MKSVEGVGCKRQLTEERRGNLGLGVIMQRKPMPYKNDLEMWHKFKEYSEHLKFVAEMMEDQLIDLCGFYDYDRGACESYCHCPDIDRSNSTKDFDPCEECWKCPHRKLKKDS